MSQQCLEFVTVDVFTSETFGGNPLAVFFAAEHLRDQQMQQIAREMNYSETTFVLPPVDAANTANIRIFTPVNELPFAGHPNVGTSYVLANYPSAVPATGTVESKTHPQTGQLQTIMRFEEKAGLVRVLVDMSSDDKAQRASISAPQPFQQRLGHTLEAMAQALNLRPDQILGTGEGEGEGEGEGSTIVSVGIEFPVVEVSDLHALQQCSANPEQFKRLSLNPDIAGADVGIDEAFLVYVYCRGGSGQVSGRMFDPLHGIAEDPATGSAAGALAGLLAQQDRIDLHMQYQITQGVEMGRPSRIVVDVERINGQISTTRISGECVEVISGTLSL
jgi:trans-2,3-dihydro-3-hydroxyanthranilate isomerase